MQDDTIQPLVRQRAWVHGRNQSKQEHYEAWEEWEADALPRVDRLEASASGIYRSCLELVTSSTYTSISATLYRHSTAGTKLHRDLHHAFKVGIGC